MKRAARLCAMGLCAGLAGCDNPQSTAQLQAFLQVTQLHEEPASASVPPLVRPPVFVYGAANLRSPFQVLHEGAAGSWQASLVEDGVDDRRARAFLEGFDLEQFELVGTLSNDRESNALLRAKGVVHRLKVGDYLGRNNGQIAWIDKAHVEVFEVISDGQGGWLERSLTIPLKQQS